MPTDDLLTDSDLRVLLEAPLGGCASSVIHKYMHILHIVERHLVWSDAVSHPRLPALEAVATRYPTALPSGWIDHRRFMWEQHHTHQLSAASAAVRSENITMLGQAIQSPARSLVTLALVLLVGEGNLSQ